MTNTIMIEKPFIFTIFGASGDLAKIKIFPALYELFIQGKMPKNFRIFGFARTAKTDSEFQNEFIETIKEKYPKFDNQTLQKLATHFHYIQGNYDQIADYEKLQKEINKHSKSKTFIKLHYFAVPPTIFETIIENLGKTKHAKDDTRLIIEKPFGVSTDSARKLFHFVGNFFDEGKVYLLDHYLGKFSVQSILNLRHSNRILNQMMKGTEVANIQITAWEDFGVENRFGYFEHMGAFKDMIQSHLLQVLALVSMSIPISNSDASLHREKYSILSAIKFNNAQKNIILGQYETYNDELKKAGLNKNSRTETFAAIRLFIDRESWYKVPIYIRTGKNLHKKSTYITVELKKFAFQTKEEEPNRLIIELQPEPKIRIQINNRFAAENSKEETFSATHAIANIGDSSLPEHANLIIDVINERKINFISFPEVIASWRLADMVEKFTKSKKTPVHIYQNHSKGPTEQHKLTQTDGFKWFEI
jgi:glucose-6-phosphate 1-dehydrogenase